MQVQSTSSSALTQIPLSTESVVSDPGTTHIYPILDDLHYPHTSSTSDDTPYTTDSSNDYARDFCNDLDFRSAIDQSSVSMNIDNVQDDEFIHESALHPGTYTNNPDDLVTINVKFPTIFQHIPQFVEQFEPIVAANPTLNILQFLSKTQLNILYRAAQSLDIAWENYPHVSAALKENLGPIKHVHYTPGFGFPVGSYSEWTYFRDQAAISARQTSHTGTIIQQEEGSDSDAEPPTTSLHRTAY